MYYLPGRTVAAIATPPGNGGVAIIRISGAEAFQVAEKMCLQNVAAFPSHTVHRGQIVDHLGDFVDDVLLLIFQGARSFTGEDTVEVHCHGGKLITERVLAVACEAGAQPALPGEFSYKAYINDKIDLTQAEAIQGVIGAKNRYALAAAKEHLQGRLYTKITQFQKRLTDLAAITEAWIDYPEEGLEFLPLEEFQERIHSLMEEMQMLERTFENGKKLSTLWKLCLIGAPNAGKSSLMNALCGHERAIVTATPGTTRDVIAEEVCLGGLTFQIMDTAGVRTTDDMIEQAGIARALQTAEQADLILHVVDATQPQFIENLPKTLTLIAWNKIDLPHVPPPDLPMLVPTSATEQRGLDILNLRIHEALFQDKLTHKEEVILTHQRHFLSLKAAREGLGRAAEELASAQSPELIALEMRHSLRHLAQIIGTDVTDDILSSIFSNFCVGK